MGAKSTVEISRQDAILEIVKHLEASENVELEYILDTLLGERFLFDFKVVQSYWNQDDPYTYKPGFLD